MNVLVKVAVVASVLILGILAPKVNGEENFFDHAEPSQHVMHIRKLTDSDKMRIELEPVWFHLESTEQNTPSESQQVKRQADLRRPSAVYSNREEFARHQQRRDSRSEQSNSDNADSFLKDFWQMDRPTKASSRQLTKKSSTSIEQQLENANLPSCFRTYLLEMYDRNSESVRKLMRCLAQQSNESGMDENDQTQHSQHFDSREDNYFSKDKRIRRMPQRSVARKRKYDEPCDTSLEEDITDEQLKFKQLLIRSDSDSGGQIFEPFSEHNASESDGSDDSSSSGEKQRTNADSKTPAPQSDESKERLYTRDGRLRPVAYRRLPQKYNTRSRQQSNSDESEEHSSGEESEESREHY
uniref:Uncharacterized protein n=1 Tax=Anopheles funestus TaxID=62324 RepID=A0A182RYB2_ANOFN